MIRPGRSHGRTEIYKALARQGISIRGKDPEMVLSTMLWRCPDIIVRLPAHGYWPAKKPYPPADYDPQLEADLLEGNDP